MGDASVSTLATRAFALRAETLVLVAWETADLSDAECSVLPKTRGHIRTSMSRSVGRQAHIRPTLISIVDHSATGHSSHVGLMELAKEMRDCSRSAETTVTLVWLASMCRAGSCLMTYKAPVKNMMAAPTFFFQCSSSLRIWNSGMPIIQTSMATLTPPCIHPSRLIRVQWPSTGWMYRSQ